MQEKEEVIGNSSGRGYWEYTCNERPQKLGTLLDLCVSSLRRGHANLLCIVPILSDDPRRESQGPVLRQNGEIYYNPDANSGLH